MENLCIWTCVYMTLCITCSLTQEQRKEYFDLNSSVNLTCISKNLSSILHNIWKIHINNFKCVIASAIDEDEKDTCKDGKVLHSMNNGESYLHIPRFTKKDEGLYHCETVYRGGRHSAEIKVYARASLSISTRLDADHRVAVCSATGAPPGVSISWRTSWNSTGNQNCTPNPDGTFDMESRVSLPDGVNKTDLECIVTHPDWNKNHTEILHVPSLLRSSQHLWQWIIISVCSVCFLTGVLTGLYVTRKNLSKIRSCKFSFPRPPPPHTMVKPQDVEELEPYASYVQRVNTIYNSSAELCNV
ncbi:cell surface glycoprotein CD200 receptor 1-A-like [Scleropages formosus]|uniref:cell surface glycoprotein CD200 receptor 1-A-like n=1 Tax=Scleropages formosus TaxID=113540 RepID=UPI0010FA88B4|nr:cell surface glycoprotein CD200 receptor 1-A [Scleropages formosus]